MPETDEQVLDRKRHERKAKKVVGLKNGSKEFRPAVAIVMLILNKLMEEGKGLVVYELAEICKDPDHKPWGTAIGNDLKGLKLAEEHEGLWHVCGTIRNIVLSAVEGEGLDMTVGNPYAETGETAL